MRTTVHSQTRGAYGSWGLPVAGQCSPYFCTGGDTQIIPQTMALHAFISGLSSQTGHYHVTGHLEDNVGPYTSGFTIPMPTTSNDTAADIIAMMVPAINSYYVTNLGVPPDVITWLYAPLVPLTLSNAPQAAITDCPADAVTNYNVVTTLLGSVTGAVNTANTKQNEIATKLNSLLSELRTLGLITP